MNSFSSKTFSISSFRRNLAIFDIRFRFISVRKQGPHCADEDKSLTSYGGLKEDNYQMTGLLKHKCQHNFFLIVTNRSLHFIGFKKIAEQLRSDTFLSFSFRFYKVHFKNWQTKNLAQSNSQYMLCTNYTCTSTPVRRHLKMIWRSEWPLKIKYSYWPLSRFAKLAYSFSVILNDNNEYDDTYNKTRKKRIPERSKIISYKLFVVKW